MHLKRTSFNVEDFLSSQLEVFLYPRSPCCVYCTQRALSTSPREGDLDDDDAGFFGVRVYVCDGELCTLSATDSPPLLWRNTVEVNERNYANGTKS